MNPLHVNSWDAYHAALKSAKIRTAIDAGANDGGYTKTLLEHGFTVHSFEPVPSMFQILYDRFRDNTNVYPNKLGLSDCTELIKNVTVLEAWTIGRPGDGGLSVKPEMKDFPTFNMQTTTLDLYCKDIPIGILKLDVDGHEFKVLRGAKQTLLRDKPPILCEFGCYLNKLGQSPEAFVNFILSLGYFIYSADGLNKFTSWNEVKDQWPYHSSFDVMLLPQ